MPIPIQVDDRDYHGAAFGSSENDADVLSIAGSAFQGVFGIGTAGGFAFGVVDATFLQDLGYLAFINMAAIHAAARMFGVNEGGRVANNRVGCGGWFGIDFLAADDEPE
jgi:hypothetical protein